MIKYLSIIILFISSVCFAEHPDSWKNNFGGHSFSGSGTKTARYANALGYEYIGITGWRRPSQFTGKTEYSNLKFTLTDPHSMIMRPYFSNLTLPGNLSVIQIDYTATHTAAQIAFYNDYMAWGSNTTFPYNIATGWWENANKFSVLWDFQQQRVIDMVCDSIVAMATRYQCGTTSPAGTAGTNSFTFAGYEIDVADLSGDFRIWDGGANTAVTLSYWTGTDSTLLHGTITHEYSTYTEAKAAFYKQLNTELRTVFPEMKWKIEPWIFYSYWINDVKNRSDVADLIPDMMMQESGLDAYLTNFVDDTNIYTTPSFPFSKAKAASTQSREGDHTDDRLIAAKAAINGAWFLWWGKLDSGTGSMPDWDASIDLVYPRLKLLRCVPSWCNLSDLPNGTESTSWDGNTFLATHTTRAGSAPFARIGTDTMQCYMWGSSRGRPFGQFRDHEMFAVIRGTDSTRTETIQIDPNRNVYDIQRVNEYFEPDGNDAKADFIRHPNGNYELVDGVIIGTNTDGGVGYRFKVSNNPVQVKGPGRTTFQ